MPYRSCLDAAFAAPRVPAAKKPSKYLNKRTQVDGVKFDSKREAKRYGELVLLQRAGLISDLERQVPFELAPAVLINGKRKRALRYVADFQYFDLDLQRSVIEDVKGMLTETYKVKRHLMKSVLGLDIVEIL